jgi:hypothetical protein
MIVRRVVTKAKTVLAGVMLEIFSASFEDWMAAFNAEVSPSRPLGRWNLVSMVETQGSRERIVRLEGCEPEDPDPNRDERPFCQESYLGLIVVALAFEEARIA